MKSTKSITESLINCIREGATVVTVNKRLSGKLTSYYETELLASGSQGWTTPPVYPLDKWVSDLWVDYSLRGDGLPILNISRSKALFNKIVRDDKLVSHLGVSLSGVAKTAYKAMVDSEEYSIKIEGGYFITEELASYVRWSGEYKDKVSKLNLTDPITVKDKVITLMGKGLIGVPKQIVFAGFDEITPKTKKLIEALEDSGAKVVVSSDIDNIFKNKDKKIELPKNIRVFSFSDQKEEVRSVAREIRAEYKKGKKIGLIVPDMEQYKNIIMREFSSELNPKSALLGEENYESFNISLGSPLSTEVVVKSALDILSVDRRKQDVVEILSVLSSPYISSRDEYLEVMELDLFLRKSNYLKITLNNLDKKIDDVFKITPDIKDKLSKWIKFIDSLSGGDNKGLLKLYPSEWSEKFSEFLLSMGWPNASSSINLTSNEFEAAESFFKVQSEFSSLDEILGKVTASRAVSELKRISSETLYQVETPDCEIEVMGMLESTGIYFDHIWILGAHRESLPFKPKPNPFIPFSEQRRVALPYSSYNGTSLMCRKLLTRIFSSADKFTVTYPTDYDGRSVTISPFFRDIKISEIDEREGLRFFDVLRRSASVEEMGDEANLPIEKGELKSISKGTGVIKNHSACPFRSFAIHRLRAESFVGPEPGLNAMDKGTVIHEALRRFWKSVGDSKGLTKLSEAGTLSKKIRESVEGALKSKLPWSSGMYFEMEVHRVTSLLEVWFAEELKRGEFKVKEVELSKSIDLGGFVVNAKIDRIDKLEDGSLAVIDYKTGECNKNDWLTERPKEPQMPIYSMVEDFDAVSFASLKIGKTKFVGISKNDDALPTVKGFQSDSRWREKIEGVESWDDLRDKWKDTLESIGADFISGNHDVSPNNFLSSDSACKYCDVKPLCRIFEVYVEEVDEVL